jgi:ABC-type tungstate transport system substrate-binding protein
MALCILLLYFAEEHFAMWIKIAILLVFIALVASLVTGFVFLIKDEDQSRRLWNSLSVRLGLASLLIGLLIYGVYTGQLGSNAPWDARHFEQTKIIEK